MTDSDRRWGQLATDRFGPAMLHNQFVLSRETRPDLPGWRELSHAGWVLQTHPTLPVIELRAGEDNYAGWLLGFPFQADRLLQHGEVVRLGSADSWAEGYLHGLAGRWLAVVFEADQGRVYLDPSGSLAAVYSIEAPIVCSTPSVIGKGPGSEDWDEDLVRSVWPAWYPFGLTPHRSLRRLLPSHMLDLERWQVQRHWPAVADMGIVNDTERATQRIVELLTRTVIGAVRAGAYMTLTAGFDTRVLLACSRGVAQEAVYFTSMSSAADVQGAKALASHLELRHILVQERRATASEQSERMYLSGYTTDKGSFGRMGNHRQQLQEGRLQVTGNGGHVGRDSIVEPDDTTGEVNADELMRKLHTPSHPAIRGAARHWLGDAPCVEHAQCLDLAYLENKMGCCQGPQQYGFDTMSLSAIHGFSQREVYALMIRLPREFRQTRFFSRMCLLAWPECLEVPVNQPWGVTRYRALAERAVRKLRK